MRQIAPYLLVFLAVAAVAAPPAGVVTTIAGNPGIPGYWDGPAQDAMFAHPTWLDVIDRGGAQFCEGGLPGDIYVIDRMNQRIRRIASSGDVSTVTPLIQFPAPERPFPIDFGSAFGGGILAEPLGAGCGCGIYGRGLFIAGSGQEQIVLVSPDGLLASRDAYPVTIGSGKSGSADGVSFNAQFHTPVGIARAAKAGGGGGNPQEVLFIADSGNHTIRRVAFMLSFEGCPVPWNVTTLAGAAGQPGSADGKGSAARFDTPRGIAALPDGTLYVADAGNHTIRRITPDGTVTTIAGVPGVAGSDDAHLNTPSGIDVSANGEVFFVDTFNHAIRMITTDGKLVTVAGQLGVSGFADGDAAAAMFNAPVGLKIAPDGSILVADTGNNVIRRVTLTR